MPSRRAVFVLVDAQGRELFYCRRRAPLAHTKQAIELGARLELAQPAPRQNCLRRFHC